MAPRQARRAPAGLARCRRPPLGELRFGSGPKKAKFSGRTTRPAPRAAAAARAPRTGEILGERPGSSWTAATSSCRSDGEFREQFGLRRTRRMPETSRKVRASGDTPRRDRAKLGRDVDDRQATGAMQTFEPGGATAAARPGWCCSTPANTGPAPRLSARARHQRDRPRPPGRHRAARQRGVAPPRRDLVRGRRFIVRDLGSRNGTLVNGQPVTEAELEPLHELRIGDAMFKFVDEGAEEYAAYRIDGAMLGRRSASRSAAERAWSAAADGSHRRRDRTHRPAELNVLLLGESGTGKEVVATRAPPLSGRAGRFPPSTARPSRRTCSRASSSATSAARSRAPIATSPASSAPPTAARFPRRDRRHAARRAGQAAPRPPVARGVPARRHDARARRRARRLRDPPRSRAAAAEGKFRGDLFARLNEYELGFRRSASARKTSSCWSRASSRATGARTSGSRSRS